MELSKKLARIRHECVQNGLQLLSWHRDQLFLSQGISIQMPKIIYSYIKELNKIKLELELTIFTENIKVYLIQAEFFLNLESLTIDDVSISLNSIIEKLLKLKKLTVHLIKLKILYLDESLS